MRFHIFLHVQYKSPYQEFCESINLYDSKSVNQQVNTTVNIQASKMRPFSTKSICPSVELQDNGCFLFCSVQPLEDIITKLRCTIGG